MNQGLKRLESRHPAAAHILDAALTAADPVGAVTNALRTLEADGVLPKGQRVGLVAMGKASVPMAGAAFSVLGEQITGGIVIGKMLPKGSIEQLPGVTVISGGHPVPDERSLAAGEETFRYLTGAKNVNTILFLISGGASALVTRPAAGISLDDMKHTTSLLLGSGASINEINTVRKHLDKIKGGGLAALAAPVPCVTLALSDVPGDRLDMIASGPTVPDLTTYGDAVNVLEKYSLLKAIPEPVRAHLFAGRRGEIHETPKPGDPIFEHNRVMIVGSLERSIEAAMQEAERSGYRVKRLQPLLAGEAAGQGRRLGRFLTEQATVSRPGEKFCWIGGGETTVTLGDGTAGKGGRNQELALAAVDELDGVKNATLVTFATDGDDGLSPAAGAVVSGETGSLARQKGLSVSDYLARHDSYTFFAALDTAIVTGPTGTNVNDLVVLLVN